MMAFVLSTKAQAQTNSCEQFKNGKFETTIEGKTEIVERNGSKQIEFYKGSNNSMEFNVSWTGDCEYTLTPTKDFLEKHPQFPKNAEVKVKIIKTTKNSYTQMSTTNFTGKSHTSEMYKIN